MVWPGSEDSGIEYIAEPADSFVETEREDHVIYR